jgi:hypothetical protein
MADPREIAELMCEVEEIILGVKCKTVDPSLVAVVERAIRMTIEAGPGTVAEICNRLRQALEKKA